MPASKTDGGRFNKDGAPEDRQVLPVAGFALLVGVFRAPRPRPQSPTIAGDCPTGDQRVMMVAQPGGRLVATNITLRFLIRTAYHVQDDQIGGGPGWLTSDGFDIVAKADPTAPLEQLAVMMRSLPAERFKLTTHVEMRELWVYALVFAQSDRTLDSGLRPTACPSPDRDLSQSQPCATIRTGLGSSPCEERPYRKSCRFWRGA